MGILVNRQFGLIAGFTLVVVLVAAVCGQDVLSPPQLVAIPLQDLRWQPLPDCVVGVYGVQVLVGDRWESVPRSLNDPNSKLLLDGVIVASLGDQVYIHGQTNGSTGAPAFLAGVERGEVVLEELPKVLRMSSRRQTKLWFANIWHDINGGIWVPALSEHGRDSNSRDAVYVTSKGEQQRYRMGQPILVHENGEVWFTSMEENESKHPLVYVWRDGQIRQTLDVPGLAASQFIFGTESGVVWAFTGIGFRRLINEGRADEVKYDVDEHVYVVRGVELSSMNGQICQIAYSNLGYFVTVCTDRDSDETYRLQLIPIPDQPKIKHQ